ncbi:MAG: GAF and ANTAR domain-containing protein [Acidimicrobiia bacterium]|nr:GAF and ANTAR domain-containing protein [Acidimicrobiia bacterium]
MSGDRRVRILAELSKGGPRVTASRLCHVSATVTAVNGAGIMMMADELPLGSLCTTNAVSAAIEDLQYTLGEGPCVDAYHLDQPVLEPDLAEPAEPRWLAFSQAALHAGARAVFGFPVRFGSARLGALNLYTDEPGHLTGEQHANAVVMAEIAAEAVLAIQAGAPPGELAAALDEGANVQYAVHQAAGMVSEQLGVSVSQALVRLRAHAFAEQRLLADVAADVVARRLRFADGDDGEQEPR